MANYKDLFDIGQNSELKNKVAVAVAIAADAIRTESDSTDNHANRLIWAKQSFERPTQTAEKMLSATRSNWSSIKGY